MNRPVLLVFINTIVWTFIIAGQHTVADVLWCLTAGLLISVSIWLYSYRKDKEKREAMEIWEDIREEKRRNRE